MGYGWAGKIPVPHPQLHTRRLLCPHRIRFDEALHIRRRRGLVLAGEELPWQ